MPQDEKMERMAVDVAFTSIGLNYFTAIVPKVMRFNEEFVKNGRIRSLRDLANANIEELRSVWRNKRSWSTAKAIATYLRWMMTIGRLSEIRLEVQSLNAGRRIHRKDQGSWPRHLSISKDDGWRRYRDAR